MSYWAVFHQKGGQGKSKIAVNFAHGFSLMNEKTLLTDIDPQNHGSKYLGIKEPSNKDSFDNGDHMYSIYDYVFPDPRIKLNLSDIVIKDARENLDILPNRYYQEFAQRVATTSGKNRYIESLQRLEEEYDQIVFDIHPSRDNVNAVALNFADYIIVPVELKTAAVESFERLFEFLESIEAENYKKMFIIPNFLDRRKKDRKIYLEEIHEMFKNDEDIIVLPVLPDKADIEDLVKYGQTMFESSSKDVNDLIRNLVTEVVNSVGSEEE